MKKEDVRIGATYSVKVSGKVVPVRITEEKWSGDKHVGWNGLNTETKRPVRIKSAAKLRAEVGGANHSEQTGPDAPVPAKPAKGKKAKAEAAPVAADAATTPAATETPASPGAGMPNGAVPATVERPAKGEKKDKTAKPPKEPKPKKVSCLDAAAVVLKKAAKPMGANEMIMAMAEQGLWSSPNGRTPGASLYAAVIREIAAKGRDARFKKTERGMFEHSGVEAGA